MSVDATRPAGVIVEPSQVLFIIGLAGLGITLFAAAMTADVAYDEEYYVAGAYFARTLSIYRDFISFQPPVYTWIASAALHVASPWYFLAARLVTGLLSVGATLLLVSLLLSAGTGRLGAFALALAFVASPFMELPLTTARNDITSLFFLLLGLRLLFARRWEIAQGPARHWGAGFFLALAASTKYTYGFAAPILALAVLLDSYGAPRNHGERLSPLAPFLWFLAGATVGALPVLYELLVNFRNFVFSTLVFNATAPFDWFRDQGREHWLSHRMKLYRLAQQSASGGNATLLIIAAGGAIGTLLGRHVGLFGGMRWPSRPQIFLAALFGAAGILAYVPTPSWPFYFAPVAALGALCVGTLYSAVRPAIPKWLAAGFLALSLLPAVPAFARYSELLARSTDVRDWTGVKVHLSATATADLITRSGGSGHIATLFPITVMDANAIRPEFASGPFLFRSANAYSAEEIAQWRGVGPQTLDTLFAVSPPAAIVGGFRFGNLAPDTLMDAALIEYAKRNGYRLVAEVSGIPGYGAGELWVRVPQSNGVRR